jgi:starch-binding outer membrane protein, SusD/RagB family
VPLHTTFNTAAKPEDAPAALADVYAQIIKDFTDAAADLPNTPPASTGKPATKPTALFLLAKTYLWRGWATNSQADFTQSFTIAKSIIDNASSYNLALLPYFGNVFREGQEYSTEVLMVIDHTKDQKFGQNSAPGSGASGPFENKSNFFWRPNYPTVNANYPAGGGSSVCVRDINNGRPFQRIRPNTKYVLEQAFANRATDARFEGTFQTAWLSNSSQLSVKGSTGVTTPRGTLINGVDTAIWVADHLVSPAQRASFKGIIFEPDDSAGAANKYTASYYPSVRKFDDSTRADQNDYSDRPYILFRFSEVYLIAAEAALKGGGTLQNAADMINVLRTRAALKQNQSPTDYAAAVAAQQVTAGQITLDFILDERSRELFAEDCRWWDLSRTQTLVNRVKAWNAEAAAGVQSYNMLRPIPQQEIDLTTEGPKYPQNPGYF